MKIKNIKEGKSTKDLGAVVDRFRSKDSEVGMNDFQNVVIRIPGNITAEIPEDKNGFLFDSGSGRVYALNRTASFIFSKIRSGVALSDIVKQLSTRYDVNQQIAVSDVQDFLYQLRELGLGSTE
ncbi:MAG: PqqD family protein [Candidatus Omnitrophica bacterium]|nr:PqqD family protein [Candidatus Omnitrophota bacterium]